jgi:TonB family protein
MAAVALHPQDALAWRRRRREGSWLWAAALSAAGHAVFVCLMLVASALSMRAHQSQAPQQVSLRALDMRQWQLNRGGLAPAVPLAPQKKSLPPLFPTPPGQVVDVAPGNNQVSPDAKYLAETNNRVRKQTKAREQVAKYGRAAAKDLESTQAPAAEAKGGGQPVATAEEHLRRLMREGGLRPRLTDLMQATPPPEATPPTTEGTGGEGEGGDAQQRSAGPETAAEGGGAPNDDLAGVAEGEGTFLNTREWKFAGFFNRVKQAVSAHWDPNGRLRAKDPGGHRFGGLDRVTFVNVTLRPDGTLADIYVARSSGLDFLDAEAVQAFERSQPFANPPEGLIHNGMIQFGFGFNIFSMSGVPRMFRSGP